MDPTDLLRLLVDPDRLAVAGALAAGGGTTDELATSSGTDTRTAVETVARLVHAGLAAGDAATGYRIVPGAWQDVARSIATVAAEPDPVIGFGMTADERQVLGRFFAGTELQELPRNRTKRLVVLERLALEFEPGRRYAEAEVNAILAAFLPEPTDDRNPDWSTLRRALVDEGLLDRAAGVYWRSGGRVET